MSPSLPPEILDSIVDHLHAEPTTLKTCCITSKSWIYRTRKHLFVSIEFHASKSHIELWKKTFLDPSSSPAHHTRHLFVRGFSAVTAADADTGGWIRTFHNVVQFHLEFIAWRDDVSLIHFRGLSPTLKSLRLTSTSLEVLDLICSFPLLEDLELISLTRGNDMWDTPSTSPKLTGTLNLSTFGRWARPAACRLLGLPNGLHFTKVTVMCVDGDVESITDLVSKCSDTLEALNVFCCAPDVSKIPPLDLSKATKLKDVQFRCGMPSIQWVTVALQSIESKDIERITINRYVHLENPVGEAARQEWRDLDRLLVHFWTAHSIRPKIMYEAGEGGNDLRGLAPSLLPELARRQAVDLLGL